MNNKILLRIFFLLAFSIHSRASIDDYIYPYSSPSYNEYGSLGLIRMPSARFHEEGTIAFHWSKNYDYYTYHNKIILRNLNKRSTNLNINQYEGIFEIRGFSWEMLCLSDNYFLKHDEFTTIFLDSNFKEAIFKKRFFLKKLFHYNMINFGNSFGRSSFRTFALEAVQDYLSMKM